MATGSSRLNYLAGILGIALLGSITTAAIFRGNAAEWQTKYTTLQASYQTAAISAKADALKQETQDKAFIQEQSNKAIQQAQQDKQQAQKQLADYKAKLKADAGMKDPGHVCSGVAIPLDLLPGQK